MAAEHKYRFDNEAVLYDSIRPKYPEELFEKLIKVAGLQSGAKLLEIGPGTGQATIPLAKKGYGITAIELGENLAKLAKQNLLPYKNVKVLVGSFENTNLPAASFDLVFVATAFHWIDPAIQFTKPYDLLKVGGHLAIINTVHVSDEADDIFFKATHPIYNKYDSNNVIPVEHTNKIVTLPRISGLKPQDGDDSLFSQVSFDVFPLQIEYSSNQYTDLINTYSPTLAMDRSQRTKFLSELRSLIDNQFGGKITKHFAMTLTIAAKK